MLLVGPAGIELGAALAFAVEGDTDFLPGIEAGLLAHAVDQAAGGAAAIEHGGRALDHFDALDVGEVAEVEGVVTHAVDEHVADGAEAANGDLVALAIAVGEADAGDVLQHVFQGLGPLVLDHALGHDVDSLGDVAQRRIDLQGATALGGLVALLFIGTSHRSSRNGQCFSGFSLNCGNCQQTQHRQRCLGKTLLCHHELLGIVKGSKW
ncbi:hypothetical protein D9M71_110630 [compost metagenome]